MPVEDLNFNKVHYDSAFVYQADALVQGKVAIISRRGNRHEPMHAGLGMRMLDAVYPVHAFH